MRIKILKICSILLFGAFTSCYDDQGNYDYHEIAEITIENIPGLIEVLGNSDHIIVQPKITSSFEGEIKDDNPDYEFNYRIELKSGGTMVSNNKWVDLNPSKTKNLDTLANFSANTYLGWFTVTDKRTGVVTSANFDIKVTSPTYEGYMVLCNEGSDSRVRMDMISVISKDRIIPAYDLLASRGLPELKNASKIGFYPNMFSQGDFIYLLSGDAAYRLDNNTFVTKEANNMKYTDFILADAFTEKPLVYATLNSGSGYGSAANFVVTDKGNAYCQAIGSSGAAFEYPINTPVQGAVPNYRVAPYIGVSQMRPGNGQSALFYDIDNKRFIGWALNPVAARQICTPVPDPDPEEKLFSFNTGMDIVYMEGTRFSDGLVYSILQDVVGARHIYGINMAAKGMKQVVKYESIDAPEFAKADKFAFHSQYPYMYYAVGNKVYSYNLSTKGSEVLTLTGETVTMLKFNLYMNPNLTALNDKSDEFLSRQFELMVGSYADNAKDVNGGRLSFYKINTMNNTLTKRIDYSGFARIIDVVYRERR